MCQWQLTKTITAEPSNLPKLLLPLISPFITFSDSSSAHFFTLSLLIFFFILVSLSPFYSPLTRHCIYLTFNSSLHLGFPESLFSFPWSVFLSSAASVLQGKCRPKREDIYTMTELQKDKYTHKTRELYFLNLSVIGTNLSVPCVPSLSSKTSYVLLSPLNETISIKLPILKVQMLCHFVHCYLSHQAAGLLITCNDIS